MKFINSITQHYVCYNICVLYVVCSMRSCDLGHDQLMSGKCISSLPPISMKCAWKSDWELTLLVFFGEETSARVSVTYWCSPSSPFLTSPICHCPVPWEQCMPRGSVLPHVLVHLPWVSHLLLQTEYHHPSPDPRCLWHLRYTIVLCAPRKTQMLLRTSCLWLDISVCVLWLRDKMGI